MEVDERPTSRTFGTKYCGRSESAPAANLATEINQPGKTPWLQPRVDVPQAFKGLIYREADDSRLTDFFPVVRSSEGILPVR